MNIYVLFVADKQLSKVSRSLIGVFDSKLRAIKAANEYDGYNLEEEDIRSLNDNDQTFGLDNNYMIIKQTLNEIGE